MIMNPLLSMLEQRVLCFVSNKIEDGVARRSDEKALFAGGQC